MRFDWCVAIACLTVGWAGQGGGAQAQGTSRAGAYGGGFLELLMNDRAGTGASEARMERSVSGRPIPDGPWGFHQPQPRPLAFGVPRQLHSGDRVPIEPEPERQTQISPQRVPVRLAALPMAPDREPAVERIARAPDARYARQVVTFDGPQRAGTIVVDTPSKFLYLVQPGGQAIRYGIGVGRPGFAWAGLKTISQKREWPDWTPPAEMIRRRPDLPRHMAGGPGNPLGARALYLGSSLYRIHGTNEPHTIGQNVSSGCIRMMNEDVIDLYERIPVGTRVEVL